MEEHGSQSKVMASCLTEHTCETAFGPDWWTLPANRSWLQQQRWLRISFRLTLLHGRHQPSGLLKLPCSKSR
jgi:cellulose synthase/poly-beta-1,6-N-acetylglucosamine synthase-like glycosyltransferase